MKLAGEFFVLFAHTKKLVEHQALINEFCKYLLSYRTEYKELFNEVHLYWKKAILIYEESGMSSYSLNLRLIKLSLSIMT